MERVPMPPDVNEQVVFSKRTMREAWPAFDEEQFRADLEHANTAMDIIEDHNRSMARADKLVSIVVIAGFLVFAILVVSGYR